MIHFISLGPGDPELITLKALRQLEQADTIYTPVPTSRKGRHSSKAAEMMLSLGIRPEQIQLYDLPMSKDRDGAQQAYLDVAELVIQQSREQPQAEIAIVAEGDCGFYSSSAYIAEHLEQAGLSYQQHAGIPAFIACNARLQGQLVQLEEQCTVIPGQATAEEWARAWQSGHTIVVMKGSLCESELKEAIQAYPERRWHYFEFVGMEKEFITSRPEEILKRSFPYFSILISKVR